MPRRRSTDKDNRGHSQRQLRVGEEIRHLLAELLERGDMGDPELRDARITVTSVDVSPDLRNATAFVMPLGGQDVTRLLAALKRAAPWFRSGKPRRRLAPVKCITFLTASTGMTSCMTTACPLRTVACQRASSNETPPRSPTFARAWRPDGNGRHGLA